MAFSVLLRAWLIDETDFENRFHLNILSNICTTTVKHIRMLHKVYVNKWVLVCVRVQSVLHLGCIVYFKTKCTHIFRRTKIGYRIISADLDGSHPATVPRRYVQKNNVALSNSVEFAVSLGLYARYTTTVYKNITYAHRCAHNNILTGPRKNDNTGLVGNGYRFVSRTQRSYDRIKKRPHDSSKAVNMKCRHRSDFCLFLITKITTVPRVIWR
jgi:hypothetical protein